MKMTAIEKVFVNRPGHSRHVALRMVDRIGRLPVRPGQRCLDVGCGNGASALQIADTLGLGVTGVDIDPAQVRAAKAAARNVANVTFQQGDATHLPFPDDSFDIVASNKTTHHIPRWQQALTEMARVTKPGGYLVYADLALPVWLAVWLRPLLGQRAGVFTYNDLSRRFRELDLELVGATTSWFAYDAVFRKRQESTS